MQVPDAFALAMSVVDARQQAVAASAEADNTLVVSADLGDRPQVSRHIFGLFLEHLGRCIYDGVWDSASGGRLRQDVVDALNELRVPNLRWPGGCFADGYHWRDGVGPAGARRQTVNQHWGGEVETNRFGSHEFMALCEAVGAEPYVVGNVGSGTVREMADWLEYLTYAGDSSLALERAANGQAAPVHRALQPGAAWRAVDGRGAQTC